MMIISVGTVQMQRLADETEIQAEQTKLVAIHHFPEECNDIIRVIFGIFRQYVRCHGVTEAFDDAGDDEQQRPQEGVDSDKQIHNEAVTKSVELGEEIFKPRFFSIHQIQIEVGIYEFSCTADNERNDHFNHGDNKKNCQSCADYIDNISVQILIQILLLLSLLPKLLPPPPDAICAPIIDATNAVRTDTSHLPRKVFRAR